MSVEIGRASRDVASRVASEDAPRMSAAQGSGRAELAAPPLPEANYARNVRIANTGVVRPKSAAELCAAVASAEHVRPFGVGHSFNETLHSRGIHLDMRALTATRIDRAAMTVWVEAGCTIAELNRRLAAEGLALRTAPMVKEVTVGGALATASHGTGLTVASFSDEPLTMEVVDARGRLHQLTDEVDLRAARAGLGSAGVVYAVQLPVVKNHDMVVRERAVPSSEVRHRLMELAAAHDRADAFYFPGDVRGGADHGVLLRTFDALPDEAKEPRRQHPWLAYFREHVKGTVVADAVLRSTVALSRGGGAFGDWLKDKVAALQAKGFPDQTFRLRRDEAAHYFPGHVAVVTMEYSMPASESAKVFDAIDATIRDTGFVPEMAFYFRVLKGSDKTLLSPSAGRDSIIVESYQYHTKYSVDPSQASAAERLEMQRTAAFMQALEGRLMALGGRAHPGKIFHQPQWAQYPEGTFEQFEVLRRRMDPDGKFLNEWSEGVLGLRAPRDGGADHATAEREALGEGPARLLTERRRDWARAAAPGTGPLVLEQERSDQLERLGELAAALTQRRQELELFIGAGTRSPVRVLEARAALARVEAAEREAAALAARWVNGREVAPRSPVAVTG